MNEPIWFQNDRLSNAPCGCQIAHYPYGEQLTMCALHNAASVLLRACEAAYAKHGYYYEQCEECPGECVADQLRDAIAKAKGEAK